MVVNTLLAKTSTPRTAELPIVRISVPDFLDEYPCPTASKVHVIIEGVDRC